MMAARPFLRSSRTYLACPGAEWENRAVVAGELLSDIVDERLKFTGAVLLLRVDARKHFPSIFCIAFMALLPIRSVIALPPLAAGKRFASEERYQYKVRPFVEDATRITVSTLGLRTPRDGGLLMTLGFLVVSFGQREERLARGWPRIAAPYAFER